MPKSEPAPRGRHLAGPMDRRRTGGRASARAERAVAIASAAGWIRERLRQLSHQQTIAATQRPVPKWRIVWTEQPMC